jgi:ATP-dependent DNA helicase RecG
MTEILNTPIEYLKGIGPQRGDILRKEAGIYTFEGLLNYFPFRYVDRSHFNQIKEIPYHEGTVQLKGEIVGFKEAGKGRGKRLEAKFKDETGSIDLIWFKGINWIKTKLTPGTTVIIWGKAKKYGLKFNMTHPELEFIQPGKKLDLGLQAVYHSGEKLQKLGFTSKGFENSIAHLLPAIKGKITDVLPVKIRQEIGLIDLEDAYFGIHQPKSLAESKKAELRLKFEELFLLQLELLIRKQITAKKN